MTDLNNDPRPWIHDLMKHMEPIKISQWFSGCYLNREKKILTVPTRLKESWISTNFKSEMLAAFGFIPDIKLESLEK